MTTKTLLDAVRADMRAKIALTHTLHELREAVTLASEARRSFPTPSSSETTIPGRPMWIVPSTLIL